MGVALAVCLSSLTSSEALIEGIMREIARQRAFQIIRLYPDLLTELYRGGQIQNQDQQMQLQQQQLLQQQLLQPNRPGGNTFNNNQMGGLLPQLSVQQQQQPHGFNNQLPDDRPNVSDNPIGTSRALDSSGSPTGSLGNPTPYTPTKLQTEMFP